MDNSLQWEYINLLNSNNGLYRLKVPGGWLIKISEDVVTADLGEWRSTEERKGNEYRSSICFYPDPEYKWFPVKEKDKPYPPHSEIFVGDNEPKL